MNNQAISTQTEYSIDKIAFKCQLNTKAEKEQERDNYERLLPDKEIAERFARLFCYGYDWIYKTGNLGWKTETRYPLDPRNLWRNYLDPEQFIGVRFGKETRYGVLDIDRGSRWHPYRNKNGFLGILHALEDIGIVRYLLVRSSTSEGFHLYFFLPNKVSSFSLACALEKGLNDGGYWLEDGHLEIFPNVKAYSRSGITRYKGHRLPLQSGSYLCDEDGNPYSVVGEAAIARFLDIAETQASYQDIELLEKAMKEGREAKRKSKSSKVRGNLSQWEKELDCVINQGFTAPKQTNQLLGKICEYLVVFEGITDIDALAGRIVEKVRTLPGYRKFCHHIKNITQRAYHWAKSTIEGGTRYPCGTRPKQQGNSSDYWHDGKNFKNEVRHQEAIARVEKIVTLLSESGNLPEKAGERAAAIQNLSKRMYGMGVSKQTLYKSENLSLWHPAHRDIEGCEQAQSERVSAPSASPIDDPPKTPETASNKVCSHPPLYEGFEISSGTTPPQARGSAESNLNLLGGSGGENQAPSDAPSKASTPGENPSPAPDAGQPASVDFIRRKKERLKANLAAAKMVGFGGELRPLAGSSPTPERLKRLKAIGVMLYLWRAGDPKFVREVREYLKYSDLSSEERKLFEQDAPF